MCQTVKGCRYLPLAKGVPVILFPLRYFSMLVNEKYTELLLNDRGSILGVARELAFLLPILGSGTYTAFCPVGTRNDFPWS